MTKIDILIPCFAGTDKLTKCVESVIKNTFYPYNLILTVQRQSVAHNRNHLLRMGHSPYVAFLDDDVEMPLHWDKHLIECLDQLQLPDSVNVMGVDVEKPFIGVVGPRIVGADGAPQNLSSSVEIGTFAVGYVCGAVMLWKRADWPNLYADTNFIASQYEDTDIVMQMLAQGGVPVIDGRVTVTHFNEMKENTSETWQQNKAYFHSKWAGFKGSGIVMPRRSAP